MKFILFWFLLAALFILNSCSSKQFSPEEADRSMKVLNSNLVNLATAGQEKPEFKALKFLFNQPTVPLPFVVQDKPTAPDTSIYNFNKKKGIYNWNNHTKSFERIENSDNVVVHFTSNNADQNDMTLELKSFLSQPYSSRPDFPVQLEATLTQADQQLVNIQHQASISDNLPETISSAIKGQDYEIGFYLNRTRTGKDGELNIETFLKSKGFEAISGKMNARIEYSRLGYFFKLIQFHLKLIDHEIEGNINYSAIDPTAADYISSFNANTSIQVFEGQNKVGQIVLNKTQNGELLDYFIRFSDGKEVLLSQYIPVLNKLLNLKY